MNKCLLLLFSLFFMSQAKQEEFPEFDFYEVRSCYRVNFISDCGESITTLNGNRLYCQCGKDPIVVMIVLGAVQCFCFDHMPHMDIDLGHNCKEEELS